MGVVPVEIFNDAYHGGHKITRLDGADGVNGQIRWDNRRSNGNIHLIDFGAAVTQDGDIAGINMDLNTNLAGANDADLYGYRLNMNGLTHTAAVTTTYRGFDLHTAGAIGTTTAAGTLNWSGAYIQMPAATANFAGSTVAAYGVHVVMANTTETAGTMNATGIFVDASGTALATDTSLLTLQQGGNSNVIFRLKSTDVSTGLTTGTIGRDVEVDDYYVMSKASDLQGGVQIQAISEDDTSTITYAVRTHGGTASTLKSINGVGLIDFRVAEISGNAIANITANGNVFSVGCQRGGSMETMFLIDEDSTIHLMSEGGNDADMDIISLSDITGTPTFGWDEGGDNFYTSTGLFIGPPAASGGRDHSGSTIGLIINQEANDDIQFALKSSDISHGLTTNALNQTIETDDYLIMRRSNTSLGGGGAAIHAITGISNTAIQFINYVLTPTNATKSIAGRSIIEFEGFEHDGANALADISANGNVFGVRARRGGSRETIFLVDAESTIHLMSSGGADIDMDIISLSDITGTPTFGWDETNSAFEFNQGLNVTSGNFGVGISDPQTAVEISHATAPILRLTREDNAVLTDQELGTIESFSTDADVNDVTGRLRWAAELGFGSAGTRDVYVTMEVLQNDVLIEATRINSSGNLIIGSGEGGTTAATGNTFRAPDLVTGGAGNIAGADLTIAAGLGTGTGDPGQIIFSAPPVTTAGDNLQSLESVMVIDNGGDLVSITPRTFPTGDIFNISYGAAETSTGIVTGIAMFDVANVLTLGADLHGINMDLATNVTVATDHDVLAYRLEMPALTQSAANTTTYRGFDLHAAGALVQDTLAGTINWSGVYVTMPDITQSAGTVNAYGVEIHMGTRNSGTKHGLYIEADVTDGGSNRSQIALVSAGAEKAEMYRDDGRFIIDSGPGANLEFVARQESASGGLFRFLPNTTGSLIYMDMDIEVTTGSAFVAAYSNSTTLTSNLTGVNIDFNNNMIPLLGTAHDIIGYHFESAGGTFTHTTGTTNIRGFDYDIADAITMNGVGGTIAWSGAYITMPDLTQTAGTATARGVEVHMGTTTSGTKYGLYIEADTTDASTSNAQIALVSGNGETAWIYRGNSNFALDSGTGANMHFTGAFSPMFDFHGTVTGTVINVNLENEVTTGTGLNIDYSSATTLTGDITGININTGDNVTLSGNDNIGMAIRVQSSSATSPHILLEDTGSNETATIYRNSASLLLNGGTGANVSILAGGATTGTLTIVNTSPYVIIRPLGTGNALEIFMETELTTGIGEVISYNSATTLTGNLTGVNIDFNANLTPLLGTAHDILGYHFESAGGTFTHTTGTTNIRGLDYSVADAIVMNGAGGTIAWSGAYITMPDLTQTAGTATARGVEVHMGTTTSGTKYGIYIEADTTDASSTNAQIGLVSANGEVAHIRRDDTGLVYHTGTGGSMQFVSTEENASGGVFRFLPTTTGNLIYVDMDTEVTTGTAFVAAYSGNTTLSGNLTGISFDFNSNVTATDSDDVQGFRLALPALTTSSATIFRGFNIHTAGAIDNDTTGVFAWAGTYVQLPVVAQTAGTVTAIGHHVVSADSSTGPITGYFADMSTSVTATDQQVIVGFSVDTPAKTQNDNATTTMRGFEVGVAGALDTVTTGATNEIAWSGTYIQMPTVDTGAASSVVTAYGIHVLGAAITAGSGTETVAGMYVAMNAATDTALHVDQGISQFDNAVNLGITGTTTGLLNIDGSTSGTVVVTVAAAAGSWTMTLPTAVGAAGEQLTDAAGDGVTSWAGAASRREHKQDITPWEDPHVALNTILNTQIYNFHYRGGHGTQDTKTDYVGAMADEAPWAMHYDGGIVNPINTFGYTTLAIQALDEKIEDVDRVKIQIKKSLADPEFKSWLKEILVDT